MENENATNAKAVQSKRITLIAACIAAVLIALGCIIALAVNSNVKYDEYAPVEITQTLDKAVLQDTYVALQFEELQEDGTSYDPARTYREVFEFAKDSTSATKTVMVGVYKNYKITAVGDNQFTNWRYTQDTATFNNPTTTGGNDVWTAQASSSDASKQALPATLKIGTVDKPANERKIELSAKLTNSQWLDSSVSVDNTVDFSNIRHVEFKTNGHGNAVEAINLESGTTIESVKDAAAIVAETGTVDGLTLEGWYTDEKCSTKFELTSAVTQNMTLYANWVPNSDTITKTYWIGPAWKTTTANVAASVNNENSNFVSETTHVKKSSKEIQDDVAVLNDTEHTTYSAAKYAEVYAEYESFMKNDDYHLYCKYNASTGSGRDDFIEFRILQVGSHTADGQDDNTALTFEATSALPLGSVPNSYHDNEGGWGASELYSDMQQGGEIYALFPTNLQNDVMSVNKKSMGGCGTGTGSAASTAITGSADSKFWVLSTSEIRGFEADGYKAEGDQYAYYDNIGVDTTYRTGSTTVLSSVPAFLSKSYTRSGANPTNARLTGVGTHHGYLMLRGPAAYNSGGWQWQAANSTANSQYTEFTHGGCAYLNGVAPAFSFGKNTITFDMQGQGEQIEQQTWNSGNFTVDTSKTTPSTSSYDTTSLTFAGWFDNQACNGTAVDLSTKTFTSSTTLYACWKATDTLQTNYWIAPSSTYVAEGQNVAAASNAVASGGNFVSETTCVLKTNTQIHDDVQKIRKGSAATIAYYKKIMNKDKYHLYTAYKGADATVAANKLLEARIIQVGVHQASATAGDNDEAALTFQSTHLLPTAYQMNATNIGTGGWQATALRTTMNDSTTGFLSTSYFNAGFTGDVYATKKVSDIGSMSSNTATTYDKFWVLSYNEMTTSNRIAETYVVSNNDGVVYDWFKARNTTGNGANACCAMLTRAGAEPASQLRVQTWFRTAGLNNNTGFMFWNHAASGTDAAGLTPGHTNAFYANDHSAINLCFAFGGTSYKVSFNMNGHGTQVASKYVAAGKSLGADNYPTGSSSAAGSVKGLKLEGWYKEATCKTKVTSATAINADTTLYANWVPDDTEDGNLSYWLSPSYKTTTGTTNATALQTNANYVSEEWNVKKTSAEIEADVAVLKRGNVSSNPTYATVLAEWQGYMTADNYHLYTKWNGSTADYSGANAKNGYIEARVINVGEHDSDDSALTFASVFEMAEGQQMYSSNTTVGGFGSSLLRANMNSGYIYSNLNHKLKEDVLTVSKTTSAGGGSTSTEKSDNQFFILSLSELTGSTNNVFTSVNEGSQYGYYKNISPGYTPTTSSSNYLYACQTRAESSHTHWNWTWTWVRTPITKALNSEASKNYFVWRGQTNGQFNEVSAYSSAYGGVVPAFAMGGYLVQFNSQGGSDVSDQLLKSKTTLTRPADPVREGYEFKGWYKEAACTNAWNFDTDKVSADTTLYAKWEDTTSSYWLNVANAKNPEDGVLKTRDEIQADAGKISAGDADTIAEYTNYMNGTNGTMDSEVHLYTKVGSGTAANDYAEFRLIAVGEHETGDGTALTWQMTHVLPNAYQVNSASASAWESTSLAASLKNNSLTDVLPTNLTNDAKEVKKSNVTSKLWVLSADEIYGASASGSGICTSAGTQYAYYAAKGVEKNDSTNECLAYRTRSGGLPTGQDTSYDDYHGGSTAEMYASWWTRDVCSINSANWCRVYNDGRLDHEATTSKRGVAVAFSMTGYNLDKTKMQTALKGLSTKPTTLNFAKGSDVPSSYVNQCAAGIQVDSASGKIGVFQSTDGTTVSIAPMTDEGKPATTTAEIFAPANCSQMFYGSTDALGLSSYLKTIDCSNLNTSNVTNMSSMFSSNNSLETINISNFNTSKVTTMSSMFNTVPKLKSIDVSSFDTSNVTSMYYMFANCNSVKEFNLRNFNTSKVTDMYGMIFNCYSATSVDVASFDTSKVTTMYGFFYGCKNLTSIDLTSFNTSKVTNMKWMFINCTNLKTIKVTPNFVTTAVTESTQMFSGCNAITGAVGTTYNSSYIDKTYARIDTAANKGYFTQG